MRNLVIIHLESLNMVNYRMNPQHFPTLHNLESQALSFNRYYSTATSTMMVITDLAYGGVLHDESCGGMDWRLKKQVYESSFLDRCKKGGYRTLVIQYPSDGSDDTKWSSINRRYGLETEVEEAAQYDDYIVRVKDLVRGGNGFVLWVCPYTSNVSYNKVELNDPTQNGIERWKSSYIRLDSQVNDIIRIIRDNNLLDDTSILFYGDHGDDLFQHGNFGGLSHAIEPLETLIHTPFFIMDKRIKAGKTNILIDTTMVADIGEKLLNLPEMELGLDDILRQGKDYVISRNLYAAQRIKVGSFEKAYSITDGEYLLIAGNRGLKFYNVLMDPVCGLNLLAFFEIQDKTIKLDDLYVSQMKYHFRDIFDSASLECVAQKAKHMRKLLIDFVRRLYESGECEERFYEIDFDNICYTIDKNFDEELFDKYYKGKRVILYGAGEYGQYCYRTMCDNCEIQAWVDRNYANIKNLFGRQIESPNIISGIEYDVVYIAIRNNLIRQDVSEWMMTNGVPKYKII